MYLFELFSQVNNKIIVLFLVSVNTIRLWDNGNVMLCYFKHSLFYNDRAHRMTIKFKLNWKRNRNLIVTLFSFAINIAVNEKKLSLCREKHVHTGMVHVWVRLYVHAFQILFHLYDGLISIFSSPKITSTLNNICSRITFFYESTVCVWTRHIHATTRNFSDEIETRLKIIREICAFRIDYIKIDLVKKDK